MENNWSSTCAKIFHGAQGSYFIVQKLSNKQSVKGVRRLTSHSKRQKSLINIEKLLLVHAFDYIVLSVNPGLTSCEELAMALPVMTKCVPIIGSVQFSVNTVLPYAVYVHMKTIIEDNNLLQQCILLKKTWIYTLSFL